MRTQIDVPAGMRTRTTRSVAEPQRESSLRVDDSAAVRQRLERRGYEGTEAPLVHRVHGKGAVDPDAAIILPQPVIDYLYPPGMPDMNMGQFHLLWHLVRHWDTLGAKNQAWVVKGIATMRLDNRGWTTPPAMQEGDLGNGGEFAYMHGAGMLEALRTKFASDPTTLALFDGFPAGPPDDGSSPLLGNSTPMDPTAKQAIALLNLIKSAGEKARAANAETDPTKKQALLALITPQEKQALSYFTSEDALYLFTQTGTLRPTAMKAYAAVAPEGVMGSDQQWNKALLGMPGVHNYLHGWIASNQSPATKITMNDPSVNLKNKAFWALHGWIESVFSGYRDATDALHIDNDNVGTTPVIYPGGPTRQLEAQTAINEMPPMGGMHMGGKNYGASAPGKSKKPLHIPASIRQFIASSAFLSHG